jgi:hypothetical protein
MMRSTVATITPASATEGSPAVFEFSLSLLLLRRPLHSPMELLEVLITLPHETGGCYYGNIGVIQLLMQNPMRPLLSLERLRLLEQSMIMMRLTVATILFG